MQAFAGAVKGVPGTHPVIRTLIVQAPPRRFCRYSSHGALGGRWGWK